VKRLKVVLEAADHARFHKEDRVSWKAAVVAWAEHGVGGIKPKTLQRYQVSLRAMRPYLDHLYLDEIGRKKMAEIARRTGVTNATRRRDLTAVSMVLQFCIAQGWIEANPAREWDRRTIKERRDPIVLPDPRDIDYVVALAPGNFAKLVRFAQYTGMRQDEIVTLERRQVRGAKLDLTKTKTTKARTIELDERAVGTLAGTVPYVGKPWVFWHGEGERYRNVASRFRELVRRAAARAEKEKRPFRPFRFHDLRHLYAVEALRRGKGIYDLQQHLGHASIKTTEIYLDHLTAEEARRARAGAGTIPGTEAAV
jgi:integrase/recombinase XerD